MIRRHRSIGTGEMPTKEYEAEVLVCGGGVFVGCGGGAVYRGHRGGGVIGGNDERAYAGSFVAAIYKYLEMLFVCVCVCVLKVVVEKYLAMAEGGSGLPRLVRTM